MKEGRTAAGYGQREILPPIQNVPRSVKEEGHEVLRIDDNGDGTFELFIKRVGD